MSEALGKPEVSQLGDKIRRVAVDEDVLVLEVAMDVALRVRERKRVERLRDDRNAVFV